MSDEKCLCTLIYGVILTRIRTGYYQSGDHILIKPMCELIDLSNITVRNALRRLEKEQYISLSKNQRATVIGRPSGQEAPLDEFCVAHETMLDLYKSYAFFLPEFVYEGFRQCSLAELEEMSEIPEGPHHAVDKPIVNQIKLLIRKLGNPLLLSMHRDILLFVYPTFLMYMENGLKSEKSFVSRLHEKYDKALELCKNAEYERLSENVKEIYRIFGELPVYTKGERFKVPVRPYRLGKIRMSFSISISLIVRISTGIYMENTFLPSAEALADQFKVSKMTIRRTIWMLNSLGVTQTINGVGTKVVLSEADNQKIRWENPVIRKNMLFFLYSMQILLMTCRNVTNVTFHQVPEEEKQNMAEEIEAGLASGIIDEVYNAWLKRIIQYTDLSGLREIYTHLKNLLIWGISLRFAKFRTQYPEGAERIIDGLRRCDTARVIDALEGYLYHGFTESRQIMIELGITAAEAVAVPLMT